MDRNLSMTATSPTATPLQTKVLRSVLTNSFTAFNYGRPPAGYEFNASDFQVWSNCIDDSDERDCPKGKQLAAVVGTLVQAGHLKSDGECVTLTKTGFDIAMASYAA